MMLRRSLYNAAQRARCELGECAEVLPIFRIGNDLGWERISFRHTHRQYAEQHVLPINDLHPHDVALGCWCNPMEYGPGVWGHYALDECDRAENGEVAIQ